MQRYALDYGNVRTCMNVFETCIPRYRACRGTPDRQACSMHRVQVFTRTLSSARPLGSNTRVASSAQSRPSLQLVDAPAAEVLHFDHDDNQVDEQAPSTQARPRYRFRNPYKKHTRRSHTPEERAAKSQRMKVVVLQGVCVYGCMAS